ncbi:MAG: hypothetical protein M3O31_07305 [Acidobacteriota bacterium]|nr:hypothetical protein [Acidobacteriota bacterium]
MIDLCDHALGRTAIRQHRFNFLLGDPGKSGRRVRLPVDAYYSELNLVIEYREIQHFQETYMDRRFTCSGMSRGEQRKVYDQRRRTDLPKYGTQVIELSFYDFEHTRGRLSRDSVRDEAIIRDRLSAYLRGDVGVLEDLTSAAQAAIQLIY